MTPAFQDGPSLAGTPAAPAPAATTTAPGAPATGTPAAAPQAPGAETLTMLIPVVIVMFVIMAFSSRKQRKQREKLLGDLRKHDRVVTTGGMIGFVAEVKPDVVVLKLEEGRDTRVTFTRDAIAAILKAAEPAANETEKTSA